MTDYQSSKAVVLDFYEALHRVRPSDAAQVISRHVADDLVWRGTHPFNEQVGASDVASVFWTPFLEAFTSVQRRQDIFLAGTNSSDDFSTVWVCSMGHLLGLFDRDWLGIPATRKMAFLPYVEFHRVDDGKIAETTFVCDLIDLMYQAGLQPLPAQTGAALLTPGPRTHDGLLYGPNDPEEAHLTRTLIDRMIDDLVTSGLHSTQSELATTWHEDMIWWGPAGIGATFTLERYEKQHQGPFGDGLTDFKSLGHQCTLAEGSYGGFFGWPSLSARPTGGFLGLPATENAAEMRIVDLYRRDGNRLAENWVFIDLLGFLFQQGLDVLGRLALLAPRDTACSSAGVM